MTKEIMDLVTKSLPAMQVEALRSELAKAARVPELEKANADLRERYDACNQKLLALENRVKKQEEIDAKLADIAKREQRFEVELLKKDVESHKMTASMQNDLIRAAFKSPAIQRSMWEEKIDPNNIYSKQTVHKGETTTHGE